MKGTDKTDSNLNQTPNQQGEHHHGQAAADFGRQLKAQRFAGAGGQHDDLVFLLQDVRNDEALNRIQIGNCKVPPSGLGDGVGG